VQGSYVQWAEGETGPSTCARRLGGLRARRAAAGEREVWAGCGLWVVGREGRRQVPGASAIGDPERRASTARAAGRTGSEHARQRSVGGAVVRVRVRGARCEVRGGRVVVKCCCSAGWSEVEAARFAVHVVEGAASAACQIGRGCEAASHADLPLLQAGLVRACLFTALV
jgi:hypothetical protein